MKNYIWFLGVFAMMLTASCTSKKEQSKKEEHFKVVRPLVKDTVSTNDYVADINAFQHVEIRARVGGFIESILVDEGQEVRKGQVLFTVNTSVYQQNLQKAKAATKSVSAELNAAKIELQGSKKLLDKNFISRSEYDLAAAKLEALEAKYNEALAEEAEAELNLSFAQIKAPYDGIINRIPQKEGSLVEEGTLLTTISNNKAMFAYFNISEVDYLKYMASMDVNELKEVSLILADGNRYPFKGVIETTESEFDRNTGTIAFRAKFPNPDNVLKHGETGKVLVKNKVRNALFIPQKATFNRQEHLCVFVVGDDHTLEVRKISPSLRMPHLFVVETGLGPKDRILLEGVQHVKEGDKIIPETVSFSQVFNH